MKKFEIEKTYQGKFVTDAESKFEIKVTKRSAKFITVIWNGAEVRRKIFVDNNGEEYIKLESYSLAPVLRAGKEVQEVAQEQIQEGATASPAASPAEAQKIIQQQLSDQQQLQKISNSKNYPASPAAAETAAQKVNKEMKNTIRKLLAKCIRLGYKLNVDTDVKYFINNFGNVIVEIPRKTGKGIIQLTVFKNGEKCIGKTGSSFKEVSVILNHEVQNITYKIIATRNNCTQTFKYEQLGNEPVEQRIKRQLKDYTINSILQVM